VVWLSGQSTESWTDGAASADLQTQTLFGGLAPGGRRQDKSSIANERGCRKTVLFGISLFSFNNKEALASTVQAQARAGDGTIFDAVGLRADGLRLGRER
jgi:hypothetical protein